MEVFGLIAAVIVLAVLLFLRERDHDRERRKLMAACLQANKQYAAAERLEPAEKPRTHDDLVAEVDQALESTARFSARNPFARATQIP